MKSLFREPLFHFLVLGAAIFAANAYLGGTGAAAPTKIVVSAAQVDNLRQAYAGTWQREPSPDELRGLVDDYVRDEIYYREGKALEVDRDDIVIRRRIRQKMEFFAEDMDATSPTDADLNAYLSSHEGQFRREESISFRQIFLSASRGDRLDDDAARIQKELSGRGTGDMRNIGDTFLLGDAFDTSLRSDITNDFGQKFSDGVFAAREGSWQGPIASSFGLHFVFVEKRTPSGTPALDEVRGVVEREWTNARQTEKREEFYRILRDRYLVVVETQTERPVESTGAIK